MAGAAFSLSLRGAGSVPAWRGRERACLGGGGAPPGTFPCPRGRMRFKRRGPALLYDEHVRTMNWYSGGGGLAM